MKTQSPQSVEATSYWIPQRLQSENIIYPLWAHQLNEMKGKTNLKDKNIGEESPEMLSLPPQRLLFQIYTNTPDIGYEIGRARKI